MYKFKYLVILFSYFSIFSQEKTIEVEYGIAILHEENLFENNQTLKSMLERSMLNAKKETFKLLLKNGNSKFFHYNKLTDDNSNYSTPLFVNYSGKVFINKDSVFTQCSILGENIYVKNKQKENWIITTETKLIDNYKCYKATNTYQVISPNKVFNHPVTAWFCPDIPYNHGPNGYGNLPGLILELQERNAVYGVRKINFNSQLNFSLNELQNIKVLTENERDEIVEKGILENK
ncbi:GLPGLI family protein [Flavobacterium dankookense]|uniref:GLPGLI family protein n=1 Tax=Flavobacterium dankookense TaxID=706186 RepID=A0A4R6QFI4_9FLAO|nr:GLPGLI family protein [Flavobacterium dankookense]TDP61313.1 GLPGLI family protein [Flavobacterium dankookense]